MNVTQADIERLERYVELLREVVDLSSDLPSEKLLQALPEYRENLKALEGLEAPDEEQIDWTSGYVADLKELATLTQPTPEQMEATRQHLENLERIEELTDV